MKEQYILKEVESVTQIAKNIFGDIVEKVYYAEIAYAFIAESETIERIDNQIESASNQENSIDQDCKTVVIEFVNGRKVIFSNSEWGCMESLSNEDVKKII